MNNDDKNKLPPNIGVATPIKKEEPPVPQTLQGPAPEPVPETATKKKTVEVDADVLEKLVGGYEKMQQKIEDLTQAADVGRLTKIEQLRNQGKLVKKAKVSTYKDKVVVGWFSVKDDVYLDEQGRIHEDQQVELVVDEGLDDNGKLKTSRQGPISYKDFARLVYKVDCEVIKESRDNDGAIFFTLLHPSGREYELSIKYLN